MAVLASVSGSQAGFKVDASQINVLAGVFNDLGVIDYSKALVRAINRTGDGAYTVAIRKLVEVVGVRSGEVRKDVKKKPAKPGGDPTFRIVAVGEAFSLKRFGPRQSREGVTASPWHEKRLFPHTFIGPGGHVYKRVGPSRLPIIKLWGPIIPRELMRDKVLGPVEARINEILPREVKFWTDKALKDAAAKLGK
jgi:hypothetical protein